MRRFYDALGAATGAGVPTLPWLAHSLAAAVDEAVLDGARPEDDPAVILLGSFIGFHTHADVNTSDGYHKLIDLCMARISERTLQ